MLTAEPALTEPPFVLISTDIDPLMPLAKMSQNAASFCPPARRIPEISFFKIPERVEETRLRWFISSQTPALHCSASINTAQPWGRQ